MSKRIKLSVGLMVSVVTLFGLFAGAVPASADYTHATTACSNNSAGATLYGNIQTNSSGTFVWFEWGKGNSLTQTTPKQGPFSSTTDFNQHLSGLDDNTTYSFRAMASRGSQTSTGDTLTFTTDSCTQQTPPPQNVSPKGYLDTANCSSIEGWAFGTNYATVNVELTDGSNSVTIRADGNRQDVGNAYPGAGNNHGFIVATPSMFRDFSDHVISAYALDASGGRVQLNTSPKRISACLTQTTPPPPPPPQQQSPTVDLTASPSTITQGQTSTLFWTSSNTTSCTAFWTNSRATSGSEPVSPSSTTTYSITCFGTNGQSVSDTATVTVNQVQQQQNPTVDLVANPSSIQQGQASTLSWTSTNTSSCFAFWTSSNATSGHEAVSPSSTTTYSITCFGTNGQSVSDTATVTVNQVQQQPTVTLTADDDNINSGDSTILRWTSQHADFCTASGGTSSWPGSKVLSGSQSTGSMTSDRTFTITCTNNFGSDSDQVTVSVDDNNNNEDGPTVDLRVDDSTVASGESTVVRWTSHNADSCRASGGTNGWSGSVNKSGSFDTGDLFDDVTYRITCTNNVGSDDDSATVRVEDNQITCQDPNASNFRANTTCRYNTGSNVPTVVLYADNTNLAFNGATTVRWITTNATSCFASGGSIGWAGQKPIGPGSFYTGSLTSTRTYAINCSNSVGTASDQVTVNVRGQVITTTTTTNRRPAPSSLVLITSTVDRNQPIVPTLDNTRPHPGDEINYTVTYQNIGTASITNLTLRVDLPYEVDYESSTPSNPIISGHTLIFNLGTLRANGQGTVTIRTRVRLDIPPGTNLNFPAILSYTDPSGFPQSVTANVSAQVWSAPVDQTLVVNPQLGASAFGAGFLPTNFFGWLLLLVLILVLVLLAKYLFGNNSSPQPYSRKVTTTTIEH